MAFSITYTHRYDILFKLIAGSAIIIAISNAAVSGTVQAWTIVAIVSIPLLIFKEKYEWVLSKLYIKDTLGIQLSSYEVKEISFLFDGSLGGPWYNLSRIAKLHPRDRKQALFILAKSVASERGMAEPDVDVPQASSAESEPTRKYCSECGASTSPDASFCAQCGSRVRR